MNSIAPALKLLVKEGMDQNEPVKLRKALKEIDRDSRKFGWTDDSLETMPPEWQWRVCTARLQLGFLDYRGWKWRNPRAGHDPFDFPVWRSGLPVYPVETACKPPQRVKKLLVYSEQGIGDQVIFAQALNYAIPYADEVVLEIEPRLAPIFQRSFPGIKIHPLTDLRHGEWAEGFDAKVLMGDLVARFLRSLPSFDGGKYLIPDPEKVERWEGWLKDKPKTGFTVAGRQGYIDPEDLPKEGINLQYGEWEPRNTWITPPIDLKEDLEDVFAITSCLDKVIGAANTNVHIAGAMGIPCDVILTPGEGDVNNAVNYRFGMGSKMYWHDSVTIYRNFRQWKSK
jgi:hypothetical protein